MKYTHSGKKMHLAEKKKRDRFNKEHPEGRKEYARKKRELKKQNNDI